MKDEFKKLVIKAKANLRGDCPLVEDEAIIWADERIAELEKALATSFEFLSFSQVADYWFYENNKHLIKGKDND